MEKTLVTAAYSGRQRVVCTYYVYFADGTRRRLGPNELLDAHRIRAVKLTRAWQHEKAPVTIDITDDVMERIL